MTILAVIPARLAAVRLPGKPLRHLGGVPLAVRVWERVTAMGQFSATVTPPSPTTSWPCIVTAPRLPRPSLPTASLSVTVVSKNVAVLCSPRCLDQPICLNKWTRSLPPAAAYP